MLGGRILPKQERGVRVGSTVCKAFPIQYKATSCNSLPALGGAVGKRRKRVDGHWPLHL